MAALLASAPAAGLAHSQPAAPDEVALRLDAAAVTQSATRARLGVLGDAFTCADARFVAYRRSSAEPEQVAQWYVASQLWADALLLGAPKAPPSWDIAEARCYLDKGFVFLDRLWDYSSAGYFPQSNPVGTSVQAARRDANGLGTTARGADGSYALRSYMCADRLAPGCADPAVQRVIDPAVDGAANAWAQHLETALAQRLVAMGLRASGPGAG